MGCRSPRPAGLILPDPRGHKPVVGSQQGTVYPSSSGKPFQGLPPAIRPGVRESVWKLFLCTGRPPHHEPRHRCIDRGLSGGAQPFIVFLAILRSWGIRAKVGSTTGIKLENPSAASAFSGVWARPSPRLSSRSAVSSTGAPPLLLRRLQPSGTSRPLEVRMPNQRQMELCQSVSRFQGGVSTRKPRCSCMPILTDRYAVRNRHWTLYLDAAHS
jgi:hypothetical protein